MRLNLRKDYGLSIPLSNRSGRPALFAIAVAMFTALSANASLAPLTLVTINGKQVLADPSGLTVYVYDRDQAGVSNCYDGCADAWPPVLSSQAKPESPLGTTARKDGTEQITYNGRPVYLYAGDQAPGQATGDGLGGVWHIIVIEPSNL